jgi:hypothetical protein
LLLNLLNARAHSAVAHSAPAHSALAYIKSFGAWANAVGVSATVAEAESISVLIIGKALSGFQVYLRTPRSTYTCGLAKKG